MTSIMGLIGHKQRGLIVLQLQLLYLTWFTPEHLYAYNYDANLKIFMFGLKWPRSMIHRMKHHFVDLYKFCTQDAPWIITGPALELRRFT